MTVVRSTSVITQSGLDLLLEAENHSIKRCVKAPFERSLPLQPAKEKRPIQSVDQQVRICSPLTKLEEATAEFKSYRDDIAR